jgi:hypothetical protein
MLKKYGSAVNGIDPVWPDGSSMRFLPIKGTGINNEKTKEIVRKRMAYHIWIKAHEEIIDTDLINIYDTIDTFGGKTLSDIILDYTNENDGCRFFTHFNRKWNNDPSTQRWSLSVRNHLVHEGQRIVTNLKDDLIDKYGPGVGNFFIDTHGDDHLWRDVVKGRSNTQEQEEDNWFDDDDDTEVLIQKGFLHSSFLQFLNPKQSQLGDEDKQSVVSWGTGDTNYTEIMTNPEAGDTSTSSITNDSTIMTNEEKDRRMGIVQARLLLQGISDQEITEIMDLQAPYELAFSGIHLPSWDADKEVFLIMALRAQKQPNPTHKPK